MFSRLKKPAQRATWSRFKAQAEYLDQVDELGDTAYWLEGARPYIAEPSPRSLHRASTSWASRRRSLSGMPTIMPNIAWPLPTWIDSG